MTWQPRRVCVNNDNFTLLVSGGGRCPWVSHALTQCGHHIQNDWANTATNLHQILREVEQSSAETVRMTQKATTRGAGDWQLHHNNTPAHASRLVQTFLVKHHITQVIQSLYSPYLGPVTSSFSQNYIHLWRERDFRPLMRFRKICQGSWWWLGELCEVPRCLLWRGLRHHYPMYSVSCICIFFNKCLYFSYYMAG